MLNLLTNIALNNHCTSLIKRNPLRTIFLRLMNTSTPKPRSNNTQSNNNNDSILNEAAQPLHNQTDIDASAASSSTNTKPDALEELNDFSDDENDEFSDDEVVKPTDTPTTRDTTTGKRILIKDDHHDDEESVGNNGNNFLSNLFNRKGNQNTTLPEGPITGIDLEREQAIVAQYKKYIRDKANVPNNSETILQGIQEHGHATKAVLGALTTTGTILVEGGESLGVQFEVSQSLTDELHVNISKYDTFVKSISNAPYKKWATFMAGASIVIYFGCKMGLLRKVPAMLEFLVDCIPTPSAGANTPISGAVERTMQVINDNTSAKTFMDFFNSPVMPVLTTVIAGTSLGTALILLKAVRLLRKIR